MKTIKIIGSGSTKTYKDNKQPWNTVMTLIQNVEFATTITSVGNYAFKGTTSLTKITLGGVKSIGSYAFSGCTGMTSLSFTNSETIIGNHAYDGCNKVTTLNLENVKTIGVESFKSLGIQILTIPSSVTAIGEKAFATCSKLQSLNYPNHKIEFAPNMFEEVTTLKQISITSTSSGRTSITSPSRREGINSSVKYPFSSTVALACATV